VQLRKVTTEVAKEETQLRGKAILEQGIAAMLEQKYGAHNVKPNYECTAKGDLTKASSLFHTYSKGMSSVADGPHHVCPLDSQLALVCGARAPVWH